MPPLWYYSSDKYNLSCDCGWGVQGPIKYTVSRGSVSMGFSAWISHGLLSDALFSLSWFMQHPTFCFLISPFFFPLPSLPVHFSSFLPTFCLAATLEKYFELKEEMSKRIALPTSFQLYVLLKEKRGKYPHLITEASWAPGEDLEGPNINFGFIIFPCRCSFKATGICRKGPWPAVFSKKMSWDNILQPCFNPHMVQRQFYFHSY